MSAVEYERPDFAGLMFDTFLSRPGQRERSSTAGADAAQVLRDAIDDGFRCHRENPAEWPASPLTPRQSEVLAELAEGKTHAQVAESLGVHEGVVGKLLDRARDRIATLYDEPEIGSIGAVVIALARGWI